MFSSSKSPSSRRQGGKDEVVRRRRGRGGIAARWGTGLPATRTGICGILCCSLYTGWLIRSRLCVRVCVCVRACVRVCGSRVRVIGWVRRVDSLYMEQIGALRQAVSKGQAHAREQHSHNPRVKCTPEQTVRARTRTHTSARRRRLLDIARVRSCVCESVDETRFGASHSRRCSVCVCVCCVCVCVCARSCVCLCVSTGQVGEPVTAIDARLRARHGNWDVLHRIGHCLEFSGRGGESLVARYW